MNGSGDRERSEAKTHGVDEGQTPFVVRFDWGDAGLDALAGGAAVVVVVDVLRFSTAVEVAVARGAEVKPSQRHNSAEEMARHWDAYLAAPRSRARPDRPFSLSPASLIALRSGDRLVLPSPNGSRLSALAATRYDYVLAGCLRNATAVGRAARLLAGARPVAVIAAGERRRASEERLRPAVEDLIGAGAILAAIDGSPVSPEAMAAIGAFHAVRHILPRVLAESVSGRELIAAGLSEDVAMAADLDANSVVPLLDGGVFRRMESVLPLSR